MFHFAFQQLFGHLLVGNIIDARASTTPVRLFQIDEGDPRYRFEQLTWLLLDFLSVDKMASVVICHCEWQFSHLLIPINAGEELTDVFYLFAKCFCSLSIYRIIS